MRFDLFSLDFWELPDNLLTSTISDNIEKNFYMRCPPEKRPRHMRDNPEKSPPETLTNVSTGDTSPPELLKKTHTRTFVKPWTWFHRKPKPEFDESLFKAFHRTFFVRIWVGGVLKLFSGE